MVHKLSHKCNIAHARLSEGHRPSCGSSKGAPTDVPDVTPDSRHSTLQKAASKCVYSASRTRIMISSPRSLQICPQTRCILMSSKIDLFGPPQDAHPRRSEGLVPTHRACRSFLQVSSEMVSAPPFFDSCDTAELSSWKVCSCVSCVILPSVRRSMKWKRVCLEIARVAPFLSRRQIK